MSLDTLAKWNQKCWHVKRYHLQFQFWVQLYCKKSTVWGVCLVYDAMSVGKCASLQPRSMRLAQNGNMMSVI